MANLGYLSNDLYRYARMLGDEHGGLLLPIQHTRMSEILNACGYLQQAVHNYETALALGFSDHNDPRARLMYAARIPLEMIAMSVRLLRLYHARRNAPLTEGQQIALRQIEIDSMGLSEEIERLWKAMKVRQTGRSERAKVATGQLGGS